MIKSRRIRMVGTVACTYNIRVHYTIFDGKSNKWRPV
jgi:hypothetical protein